MVQPSGSAIRNSGISAGRHPAAHALKSPNQPATAGNPRLRSRGTSRLPCMRLPSNGQNAVGSELCEAVEELVGHLELLLKLLAAGTGVGDESLEDPFRLGGIDVRVVGGTGVDDAEQFGHLVE